MALLVETGLTNWISDDEIAGTLRNLDPKADIRTPDTLGDPAGIRMIATVSLPKGRPADCPNLELVQKLGAGVESIVTHPTLPAPVRVTRLRPDAPAREIAEWFLTYILQTQRQTAFYRAEQQARRWTPVAPLEALETTVGVLGLGHIGGRTAALMQAMDFRVLGWSRSPKTLDGVETYAGLDTLPDMLGQCDHVCAILPSTHETRDLIGPDLLSAMKPGATLLNAGRGDLIDEAALIASLDTGHLGAAVLDVTSREPLPADNPLWSHARVTITPHVSGWHLGDAFKDITENYRRLLAGDPLLHEVDRQRGY